MMRFNYTISPRYILVIIAISMLTGFVFVMFFGNTTSGAILAFLTLAISFYLYSSHSSKRELKERNTASDTLLHSVFNHTKDGMFIVHSKSNRIMDCNPSALIILGAENSSSKVLNGVNVVTFTDKDNEWFNDFKKSVKEKGEASRVIECTPFKGSSFKANISMIGLELYKTPVFLLRIHTSADAELSMQQFCQQYYELLLDKSERNIADTAMFEELKRLGFEDKRGE